MELRISAMRQPGYISGETLRGNTLRTVDDPSLWLVISTWVDAESWQKWQMVPERREIESKIEALLVAPEEVTILKIAGR
jgi:heme-degrading monooxygenase HmoA